MKERTYADKLGLLSSRKYSMMDFHIVKPDLITAHERYVLIPQSNEI